MTNPYTGGSYGTTIPTGSISQIALNTLKQFYPDPNVGDPTAYTDDNVANYQANVDDSGHSDQFDVRGDQYFGSNQKFLVWGRFTWKNFPISSPEILLVPSGLNNSQSRVLKFDTNWSIKPSLINEAGFGFTRYTNGATNSFNGNAWTTAQGWVGLQNLFYNGIPEMDFNNIQSLNADRLTGLNKSFTYDYSDTLIWTKGNHTLKFGGDIQSLEAITPLGFNGSDNYGTYQFNTSGSTGMFTGVDFADFLLGLPNQSFYDVVKQDNDGISQHYAFYGQDEWRLSPRLTLSYGLRYELHPGYYDKYGDIGNFDPSVAKAGRVIYPQGKQRPARTGLPRQRQCLRCRRRERDQLGHCQRRALHAGSGQRARQDIPPVSRSIPTFVSCRVSASPGARLATISGPFAAAPACTTSTCWAPASIRLPARFRLIPSSSPTPTTRPPMPLATQWPQIDPGSGGQGCTNCYGTDYFGTANSTNWKDPYTEQWSLSVDHDFGSGYAARVTYIGSETHQLVWAPDENTLPYSTTVSAFNAPISSRLFPNWGRINTRATGANESYNSLQLEGSHRLQQGLEFHSGLTWAKNLADNEGPYGTGFAGEGGGNRASSILNRHVDFGNAYGTRKLRWNTTALYDLPFGRGKMFGTSMSRIADEVVGGWRLSSILTVMTGPYETPYFPSGQGDPSGTGSGLNGSYGDGTGSFDGGHRNQHADLVPGMSINPTGKKPLQLDQCRGVCLPRRSDMVGWQSLHHRRRL